MDVGVQDELVGTDIIPTSESRRLIDALQYVPTSPIHVYAVLWHFESPHARAFGEGGALERAPTLRVHANLTHTACMCLCLCSRNVFLLVAFAAQALLSCGL